MKYYSQTQHFNLLKASGFFTYHLV